MFVLLQLLGHLQRENQLVKWSWQTFFFHFYNFLAVAERIEDIIFSGGISPSFRAILEQCIADSEVRQPTVETVIDEECMNVFFKTTKSLLISVQRCRLPNAPNSPF